ncbi:trypco2 family protein [Amycolatopsis sp. NPDC051758]|uniref:trypco2 family protein n=1 Tax=Amycolatopsis sp. NPDC051758 TaxID=3363935 RepID=UPI00379C2BD1
MDVELTDAVAALRDELIAAAAKGVGAGVGFVVGPIELEFGVELKKDAKLKTGFKAWVVSGDAEVGVAHARTHRVRITLTPKTETGEDILISGSPRSGPGDVSGHIPD